MLCGGILLIASLGINKTLTIGPMSSFRIERDSMGEVRLPAQAYYGAQTQRAVENFPISGKCLPPEMIHGLGLVKWAAASANADLGRLSAGKYPLSSEQIDALLVACLEVSQGKFDREFPVDVFQTGSGTSSNMNANEVIANRAIELSGGDRFSPEKAIQSKRPRQFRPKHQRHFSNRHACRRGRYDPRTVDPRPGTVPCDTGGKSPRSGKRS